MAIARAEVTACDTMSVAEAGSSSTTHEQLVDESLGISESEFSFG